MLILYIAMGAFIIGGGLILLSGMQPARSRRFYWFAAKAIHLSTLTPAPQAHPTFRWKF